MRFSDGAPASAGTWPPLKLAIQLTVTVTAGPIITPKRKSAGVDLHTLGAMDTVQPHHAGIAVRSRTG